MANYLHYGEWDKISERLQPGRWSAFKKSKVYLNAIHQQRAGETPGAGNPDDIILNVKTGPDYVQNVTIAYQKADDDAKAAPPSGVSRYIIKVEGKNKSSFDILSLHVNLNNIKQTMILLKTKNPDATDMPDDMRDFIANNALTTVDAPTLVNQFQQLQLHATGKTGKKMTLRGHNALPA